MAYLLTYSVPYEGDHNQEFANLDALALWLDQNKSSYNFNLDNVDVVEIKRGVDVYQLMRNLDEARAELARAGFPPEVVKAGEEARAAGLFQDDPSAGLTDAAPVKEDKVGE